MILISCVVFAAVTLYLWRVYSTFSRHGVKQTKVFPLLGSIRRVVLRFEHMAEHIDKLYKEFSTERFFGRYDFINPIVVIRDIELIKRITVKDFEHFLDHQSIIDKDVDPLFGRNLLSLKGQEWKDMRSSLSPAFTSSKIKSMVPFMIEVGEQMIKALKLKIDTSSANYIDIDSKELTTRYANDVVASCAFGLKIDSLLEKQNQFYLMVKAASTFQFKQMMMFLGYLSIPSVMKFLKISLFTDVCKKFFSDLVLNTIKDREARKVIRPDLIHLLMEAKKGVLTYDETSTKDSVAGFATVEESAVGKKQINKDWSDEDLVAQAMLFFIAGFDTISSTMAFMLHELAVNPEVQSRLVQEIREHEAKNGGKLDYNSIQSMVYMDMVVSEVLRLWTPAVNLDRVCTKDYNLGKPNNKAEKDFTIRKGTGVAIPVWAIHRDPYFFPDPLKFDPERFSEENKHQIQPFTYMPFGLGPRNCIGSRFALCEVKVMMYQLLLHMEVTPCARTCIPIKLCTSNLNLAIAGGHWVRLTMSY